MGLTVTAALSLFFLLATSSAVYFLSERIKVPYTVLLVAVGTFLLVPLSHTPFFAFIQDFTLTPEILFYFFLPILIFESAYNINVRRLAENLLSISMFAVVSLLISTAFIAVALTFALSLVGLEIPFIVCLLFAALISATDPVAVLALFKEVGAPRRLTLLFEGESIFNDGTAVALFFVVLAIALEGFHGFSSVSEGILSFTVMVLGGIVFGIIMGALFANAVGYAKRNEFVQITLTIVLAHLTFILTDFISQNLVIGGYHIHLSAIIATTLAAMVMGNYGRSKIPPKAEEFIEKFWGQFAFLANSLVFILIGLIFTTLPFSLTTFALPILIAVLIVAIGRALSIYPVTALLNATGYEEKIPRSWSHLLAWGSLRGALAITMVLLIPDSFTVSGWAYDFSPKEFILALTIGCIFATLFIKATTITWLMEKLGIGTLHPLEKTAYTTARRFIARHTDNRLSDFVSKGYVDADTGNTLRQEFTEYLDTPEGGSTAPSAYPTRVLRMFALGIERHYLKELYSYGEITEAVYKRILGKLTLQYECADEGIPMPEFSKFRDSKDMFDRLAEFFGDSRSRRVGETPEERFMYYRAQSIIARKVIKTLNEIEASGYDRAFGEDLFDKEKAVYEEFRLGAEKKMEAVIESHPKEIRILTERLARRGLLKVEESLLDDLYEKQMITPKVFITIHDEIEHEADKLSESESR